MANNRKKYTENDNILLYNEVDGICPLCLTKLMYVKNNQNYKNYEIAHIYPLNATADQIKILANEKRLSNDLNSLSNLILLCLKCHNNFDNPRTAEEYRSLFSIKKQCLTKNDSKEKYTNYQIESEISKVIKALCNMRPSNSIELGLLVLKLDDKADHSLSLLTKRNIQHNISDYFLFVQQQFAEIDAYDSNCFEAIATQVKSIYLQFKKGNYTQEEIYDNLSSWLNLKTSNLSLEASKIIISFFIQNCEVFS